MRPWFTYIMSNNAHTLYVGATDDLPNRVRQHKERAYESSFTARYTFDRCVWFEYFATQKEAIAREQQIKRWSRAKKIALIERENPWWDDLSLRFSLIGCSRDLIHRERSRAALSLDGQFVVRAPLTPRLRSG